MAGKYNIPLKIYNQLISQNNSKTYFDIINEIVGDRTTGTTIISLNTLYNNIISLSGTTTSYIPSINYSTPDLNASFDGTIKFDKIYTQYNDFTGSTNTTIGYSTLNAVPGSGAEICIFGDGLHNISFNSGFTKTVSSFNYDHTLGKINLIFFIYDGTRYWYSITQNY